MQHSVDVVTLLSDELRNECVSCLDTTILAIPLGTTISECPCRCLEQQVTVQKKKLKTGGSTTKTLDDTPSVPSKSEQRKLKQLERQKQAQAKVNGSILVQIVLLLLFF